MAVHKLAFGYDKEAQLTAALLDDASAEPRLSLMALYDDEAVGHVLFTRAVIEGAQDAPLTHILAPLAVKPAYQRRGVGGMLINAGLEQLKDMGCQVVFVLGHKEYYPRYGFMPHAMHIGYPAPYPIPEENSAYWMYQFLTPAAVATGKGRVICADTLARPEHWRE